MRCETKSSKKGQNSPGYDPKLLAAVLDAKKVGWENVTDQGDAAAYLKFKTAVLDGTSLRDRSLKLDLSKLFERIYGPILELLRCRINEELGKRASCFVGETREANRSRLRLREFDDVENRRCFAFNIVFLALSDHRQYEKAWKSFCEQYSPEKRPGKKYGQSSGVYYTYS